MAAGDDLSGRNTLRPLADGMVRWDIVYPVEDALEWHRLNGRMFDSSRYEHPRKARVQWRNDPEMPTPAKAINDFHFAAAKLPKK